MGMKIGVIVATGLLAVSPALSACLEAARDHASIALRLVDAVKEEGKMTIVSAAAILKDPDQNGTVSLGFAELGFEVQEISPGVLLLTGEPALFEKEFGSTVSMDDSGAHVSSGGQQSRALPLDALPRDLRGKIDQIGFDSPPDFGPGNY